MWSNTWSPNHISLHIMSLPPTPIVTSKPGETFLDWLTNFLAKIDNRELTIAASSLSVISVMIIGSCIWCVTHFCKRRYKKTPLSSELDSSLESKTEHFFEGWKVEGHSEKMGKPKIMNGANGKSRNISHHKMITPDKHIEFVIPTISMPAQPFSIERELPPELPTCSRSLSRSQQFYPQFVQGEEEFPKIGFSLYYEATTHILYVRLLGGRNMPDTLSHCITVKLYPGRGGKQRTREFLESNPIYNQEFSFHIRKSTLCTRVLKFKATILETPRKVIGTLNLALKDLPGFEVERSHQDLQSSNIWKYLEQLSSESAEGIKLRVSLQWNQDPPPGLLTLKVIEATGLHEASSGTDFTSTHVKVSLHEQGRIIKSRKTRLIRWGSIPIYEDVFVVTIPFELLNQISFLLEIVARGRLGSKVILGKISIGPLPYVQCPSTAAVEFWEEMCHCRNSECMRWLQLS